MSIELMKQAAQQAVDAFDAFGDADDFASLFELTRRMRALRTAIQQADVTGEREAFESCALMEGSLFKRRADDPDKYWDGNVQDDWELWQARAILALRPERVPMTDDQIRSMCKQGWVFETVKQWVSVIEAHHGIKAHD